MPYIIHVDLDAFYASCEELDNPSLRGKPLAVAGKSDRAIITTANYKARTFGIHSAMPVFMARQLCENLIIVPMRRNRYLQKSKEVFDVLKTYTEKIEKVSIDESYLDLTDLNPDRKFLSSIQNNILVKTGLSVSIGMSFNKFLAKLASDWNKPGGIKIIEEKDIPYILMDLDIRRIHGIGKKSEEKLRNLGINKVKDLYSLKEDFLTDLFGRAGEDIFKRIRGIDDRKVEISRERKSLGTESTFFATDDKEVLENYIKIFSEEVSEDLIKKNISGFTLTIKLKNEIFQIRTKSKTYDYVLYNKSDIYREALVLFREFYSGEKIRLLGITVSNLINLNIHQMTFL